MNSFEHLVLTRFNVRLSWLDKYGHTSHKGLDPDWLNHRFRLFEQLCYPSLRHQTNQQFKWLVFFDTQTPEAFKERINTLAEWENFVPVYVDCFDQNILRESLSQKTSDGIDFLITTRVDNDDALNKSFIESIQENFSDQEFEFINFVNGFILNLKDAKLYNLKHLSSPFSSLIERRVDLTVDGFRTILCEDHGKLSDVGFVRQIYSKPLWMQIIHDKNVCNSVRGIRRPLHRLKDEFTIDYQFNSSESYLSYQIDKVSNLVYAILSFAKRRFALEILHQGVDLKERLFNRFF